MDHAHDELQITSGYAYDEFFFQVCLLAAAPSCRVYIGASCKSHNTHKHRDKQSLFGSEFK